MKERKKQAASLNDNWRKVNKTKQKCYHFGCNETAIKSHILQKNGILSEIATDNHLRMLQFDFFKDGAPSFFKRIGINDAFVFKGFCQKHDSTIFAPIEQQEIDFSEYKNNLLFAYRTLLNERRKKEYNISFNNALNNEHGLFNTQNDELSAQNQSGINDIDYYINIILSDIDNNTENFVFFERRINKQEVCISSSFSFETVKEQLNQISSTGKDFEILTAIFICFFPIKNKNILLIGYLKSMEDKCGKWVRNIFEIEEKILLKTISDLMLTRCEQWACSENFYKKNIQPREEEIEQVFIDNFFSSSPDEVKIKFNIFEEPL